METNAEIEEFLRKLLKHSAGGEYKEVGDDATLPEAGLDSFGFVMLYLTAGELFNIEQKVYDEKLPKDATVTMRNFMDFIIENKLQAPTMEEALDALD